MQEIKELLEVYNHYIKLPLIFMNGQGEIEHIEDYNDVYHNSSNLYSNFSEIGYFINYIKSPTVVTIQNVENEGEPHYVISPVFQLNGESYYIIAGPFAYVNSENHPSFKYLSENDVNDVIQKMNKLFMFILNKEKRIESELTQYLYALKCFISNDIKAYNALEMVMAVLTQLTLLKNVDFTGVAILKENGLYEIVAAKGSFTNELLSKRFFWNEGIFGEAIQEERPLIWESSTGEGGIEFFLRNNVIPKQLLTLPYTTNDSNKLILYVGNVSNEKYERAFIDFIEVVLAIIDNIHEMKSYKKCEQHIILSIHQLNTIIDHIIHREEIEKICSLVFEAVSSFVGKDNVCLTTNKEKLLHSATVKEELKKLHVSRAFYEDDVISSYNNQYIYYYVKKIGHFSIKVTKDLSNRPLLAFLNILNTLIDSMDDSNKLEHTINIMYSSTSQLQPEKYQLIAKILKALKNIRGYIGFNEEALVNLFKLLAYEEEHQKNTLGNGIEALIYKQATVMIQFKGYIEGSSIEAQVYAYIYLRYILNIQDSLDFTKDVKEYIDKEILKAESNDDEIIKQQYVVQIDNLSVTKREKQVLKLVIEGLNNHEIAEVLSISAHTVKNHVTNIFKKLNVSDRIQLMTRLFKSNILD